MVTRLALAGLLLLAGCASAPQLQPIPAPLMPTEVKVPVQVALPLSMTEPCPEPPKRAVTTDVELLELADAFRVQALCNAAKLAAIKAAQP